MSRRAVAVLTWLGCAAVIAAYLRPVWSDWTAQVPGPYGGVDALLQMGLLEWSARHPLAGFDWLNLPIHHPTLWLTGAMDSLLGQAWLVWPFRHLPGWTWAAQYNLALLLSLVLAAAAAAWTSLAAGGARWAAGVTALALVGSPYVLSQIGHLNQVAPAPALLALGSLLWALRRWSLGEGTAAAWWLFGLGLALQAVWGWYGLAFALAGGAVIAVVWTWRHLSDRSLQIGTRRSFPPAALPALLLAAAAIWFAVQPQLRLRAEHPTFTRADSELEYFSADAEHLIARGAYRAGPDDWRGRGVVGEARYAGRDRPVLHPGWTALILGVFGFVGRRRMDRLRRRTGLTLLIAGGVGLVLAFGESVGLPFTDARLPLPMAWLRDLMPASQAFRAVWRFSFLWVLAVAWWAGAGAEVLLGTTAASQPWWRVSAALALIVALAFTSLPAALSAVAVPFRISTSASTPGPGLPVLSLPSVPDPLTADPVEALWLARALETGRPVTGGATGWEPPTAEALRARLTACENGAANGGDLLRELRREGYELVEVAARPGDDARMAYWNRVLRQMGAVVDPGWPRRGYVTWRLPAD